jgi:hypothetical protein
MALTAPLFTVAGWRGERGPGSRMGSSFGIGHRDGDVWVEVVSHDPSRQQFDDVRDCVAFNTLCAARAEVDPDKRPIIDDQVERLQRGEGAVVVDWQHRLIPVDRRPVVFAVHTPVPSTWCGITRLDEVIITIDSRGLRVGDVALVTVSGFNEDDWNLGDEPEPLG